MAGTGIPKPGYTADAEGAGTQAGAAWRPGPIWPWSPQHMASGPGKSIPAIPPDLREIPGRNVAERGRTTREWSIGWNSVRHLMSRHIVSVGMSHAGRGFAFARRTERLSVVMACLGGSGRATVNGQAVPFASGQVYRMPAQTWQAYWVVASPWDLLWICYAEDPARPSAVGGEPAVSPGDATILAGHAFALKAETEHERSHSVYGHLAELIDIGAKRLVGAAKEDPLAALWSQVEADIAREWTLGDLARLAGRGEESLRLECLKATGYSPMAQVAALRIRRAAVLLAQEGATVTQVAEQVGYANPFAFSTSFKRWMNMSPANLPREAKRAI